VAENANITRKISSYGDSPGKAEREVSTYTSGKASGRGWSTGQKGLSFFIFWDADDEGESCVSTNLLSLCIKIQHMLAKHYLACLVALISLFLSFEGAGCFDLPGVYPRNFDEGERVPLTVRRECPLS